MTEPAVTTQPENPTTTNATTPTSATSRIARHATLIALVLSLVVAAVALLASRHQSASFDEIFMVASGARGYEVGDFALGHDHPPGMQYLYGLPVWASGVNFPDEAYGWNMANRFVYARQFYFTSGNDPERLALWSRMVAALIAGALAFATYRFARPRIGTVPALGAAVLTGFTPDVLAHGGVAYNDLPIALAFLLAVWAIDDAVRRPAAGRVALAAFAIGVAMAIKFSALALGPIAVLLLVMEATRRWRERDWWRRVALGIPLATLVFYLTLVAGNGGDFTLDMYRKGMAWALYHSGTGHSVPAYLFGQRSTEGFWYFYPVLFFLKTPVALHILMALALVTGIQALRGRGLRAGLDWLQGPLRPAVITLVLFGAVLIRSNLNIGLRHALPLVPVVIVLTMAGVAHLVRQRPRARTLAGALVALAVVSTGAQYPNFLSYLSEYALRRDRAYEMLADSSLDWGQGLVQLRDWMRENDVERIYFSYFGSALPEAYGIDYIALPSYFAMQSPGWTPLGVTGPDPEWVVISATNLAGVYLEDDPFAAYRGVDPALVIANHLYVFPVR